MNKNILVSLLILLMIGQVKCSFWDDLTTGVYISGATAAGATILAEAGLALWGFSSIGPVAGSAAAIAQASMGNVVAGSAFAIAQSVAMSGLATVALPATAIGAAVGAGYIVYQQM